MVRMKCSKCGCKLMRMEKTINGMEIRCNNCRIVLLGLKNKEEKNDNNP